MIPPRIEQSTREERRAFVLDAWKCLHDCETCGKCRVLRGKDAYMEITMEIRNNNYFT